MTARTSTGPTRSRSGGRSPMRPARSPTCRCRCTAPSIPTVDVPYQVRPTTRTSPSRPSACFGFIGLDRPPAGHQRAARQGAVPPRPGHGRREEPRSRRPLPPGQRSRGVSCNGTRPAGQGRGRTAPVAASTSPVPGWWCCQPTTSRPGQASPEFGPATSLYERFLWSLFEGDKALYNQHRRRRAEQGSTRPGA